MLGWFYRCPPVRVGTGGLDWSRSRVDVLEDRDRSIELELEWLRLEPGPAHKGSDRDRFPQKNHFLNK